MKTLRDYINLIESAEQSVAEGIGKSIKRGLQGWRKGDNPKEIRRLAKDADDADIKGASRIHTYIDNTFGSSSEHSPVGFNRKVIDREMKKRGLGEQGVAEGAHQDAADEIFNNLLRGSTNAIDEKNFIRSVLKAHGLTTADAPQVIDLVRKLGYAGDKFKEQGVAEGEAAARMGMMSAVGSDATDPAEQRQKMAQQTVERMQNK